MRRVIGGRGSSGASIATVRAAHALSVVCAVTWSVLVVAVPSMRSVVTVVVMVVAAFDRRSLVGHVLLQLCRGGVASVVVLVLLTLTLTLTLTLSWGLLPGREAGGVAVYTASQGRESTSTFVRNPT